MPTYWLALETATAGPLVRALCTAAAHNSPPFHHRLATINVASNTSIKSNTSIQQGARLSTPICSNRAHCLDMLRLAERLFSLFLSSAARQSSCEIEVALLHRLMYHARCTSQTPSFLATTRCSAFDVSALFVKLYEPPTYTTSSRHQLFTCIAQRPVPGGS